MLESSKISAFSGLRSVGDGRGVVAQERTGLSIATVMARKGQAAALAQAVKTTFGIRLPTGPRWQGIDRPSFLGVGPDRWLAIHATPTRPFVNHLAAQLNGLATVVDQSDAYGVLRLSGPALLETLAKGVAVDLSTGAFPVGSVAVTQIAHVGAILWKIDELPMIDIAVARSLAGSFLHWLTESAAVHGLAVEQR